LLPGTTPLGGEDGGPAQMVGDDPHGDRLLVVRAARQRLQRRTIGHSVSMRYMSGLSMDAAAMRSSPPPKSTLDRAARRSRPRCGGTA
jgi:hypothetical protein